MNTALQHRNNLRSLLTAAGICAGALVALQKFRKPFVKHFDLSGKTVLITGGSRGFGLALAEEFGEAGARIALCARDQEELQRACQKLSDKHIEAHGFRADISQPSEVNALVDHVIARFGKLDVLVNDAGAISVGSFDSFSQADFEAAMNLMFWAPVNLTRAALRHMRQMGGGQIVNITSVGGRVSIPHLLPYCCAKFAFVGFSTGITAELKAEGIHTLTVVPGLMRTGSYLNANFKGSAKEEFAWFGLLGNLPGFSVAAGEAATEVRESLERQDYTCTISLPAKLLIALEALAPDANRALMEFAATFLPKTGAKSSHVGRELNPAFNFLFQKLTGLGRMAAQHLNE